MNPPSASSSKVRTQFLKYAVGLTSVCAASSASAQVISWDSNNATGDGLTLTSVKVGFWLNGVTTNTTDGALTLTAASFGGILYGTSNSAYSFLSAGDTTAFTFYNFGELITGGGDNNASLANTASSNARYLGFQKVVGEDTNFGWAEIIFNDEGTVTLNAFGYESTAGASITAGATAVPEPASAALALAAGALGFAALRRRRAQKQAAK